MTEFGIAAEEIPDLATPIRAWRVWRVDTYRGRWALRSSSATAPRWMRREHGVRIGTRTDLGSGVYWPIGGIEARCLCVWNEYDEESGEVATSRWQRHEPPGPTPDMVALAGVGFGCGVYGVPTESALRDSPWVHGAHALGEVELGGKVWRHTGGWRAQYGRVAALSAEPLPTLERLYGEDGSRHIVGELARRYRVPLLEERDGRDR